MCKKSPVDHRTSRNIAIERGSAGPDYFYDPSAYNAMGGFPRNIGQSSVPYHDKAGSAASGPAVPQTESTPFRLK